MEVSENQRILELGEQILSGMDTKKGSIFRKDYWYGQVMDWSMKNKEFKTQMFRFVDVLPYLHSGEEVARHLKEYFSEGSQELPSVFNFGLGLGSLAPGLMAGAVRKNVTQMAKMFITGETPEETIPLLMKQRDAKVSFTIDLLGEASLSRAEAKAYQLRYLDLIETLGKAQSKWTKTAQIDEDNWGDIPKSNVSVKLTAICAEIKPEAWEDSIKAVCNEARPILSKAMENGIFVNFDMESYDLKDLSLSVFKKLLEEPEFRGYPHFGIVLQAYLRDSFQDCRLLSEFAAKRGAPFSIRLVKGAYWDFEVVRAQQNGWPSPVFLNKQESDANFEKCTEYLLSQHKRLKTAIGSHNVRSIAFAIHCLEKLNLPKSALEIQMLFGMADPFKSSLVALGFRIREYATVGELIPGMAYLVRRLLENTSNESFLKSKFVDNTASASLLKDPAIDLKVTSPWVERKSDLFENHPLIDWTHASERTRFQETLAKKRSSFPIETVSVVNGKRLRGSTVSTELRSPIHNTLKIANVFEASFDNLEEAIGSAEKAVQKWKDFGWEARAQLLDDLASEIANQRYDIMATQVFEVGKQWKEADGEICEAIDFCRYYAREARKLGKGFRVGNAPGEHSHYLYEARGVTAVIAPWNFPFAILTGMVTAALVTGNTVVMKPAEQSPISAQVLMNLLLKVGFPKDVVHLILGPGETLGDRLAKDSRIATVSFTGSKEVGVSLLGTCARIAPGQKMIKRPIIEMGGKNAIIVDSDADLDEAIEGILHSAFGFQGQKCSACSRVVVVGDIYGRFMERLKPALSTLAIGPSDDPKFDVGAVIDAKSRDRILELIATAKAELQSAPVFQTEPESVPQFGHYVPITVFENVAPTSRLAQEEIFGPVLAVIRAKTFEEAIEITNSVEFGLTAGVYSRSPKHIDQAKKKIMVGNLYINRGCTGAMVDRHPFGGFKLSGVGSKTGGPDYLKQYCEPRVVIENTMRRGFTPEIL